MEDLLIGIVMKLCSEVSTSLQAEAKLLPDSARASICAACGLPLDGGSPSGLMEG